MEDILDRCHVPKLNQNKVNYLNLTETREKLAPIIKVYKQTNKQKRQAQGQVVLVQNSTTLSKVR